MSNAVVDARTELCHQLLSSPIPPHELIRNLGLYLLPMEVRRILFFAEIYEHVLKVPGVLMEFGTRWGQNLALLQSLRAIREPFHHRRLVVGFDTFEGFPAITPQDGSDQSAAVGAYSVSPGYDDYLRELLGLRETQSPISEVAKYRVVRGNAPEQLQRYLAEHPETIIALAYFDMDLYQPTLECLKLLKGRLTRGSVIGFDELNHAVFPGETTAVIEALGLDAIRLRRSVWSGDESYFVVGET